MRLERSGSLRHSSVPATVVEYVPTGLPERLASLHDARSRSLELEEKLSFQHIRDILLTREPGSHEAGSSSVVGLLLLLDVQLGCRRGPPGQRVVELTSKPLSADPVGREVIQL